MLNKCTFKEKQREKKKIFTQPTRKIKHIIRIYIERMFVFNIYKQTRHSYANSSTDENSLMDLYLHKVDIYIRLVSW